MAEKTEKSLSRRSVEGTLTLILTRFLVRLIGFVSISFTARLLTPEDFGLVGAASIVIGLFAILNQVGLNEYIQRTPNIVDDELYTLWTLKFLINLSLSAGVFLAAPLAAELLQEPRLIEVLQVLSVSFVLGALRAPAAEFFNRDLNYKADLVLKLVDKSVMVITTIAAAFILKTYWALVWGQIVGAVFSILSSYIAKPFLPRLTLKHGKSLGGFAFWTSMVAVTNYGVNHADEWIAKRSGGTAAFGAYHIARDLCRLFVAEIIAPAGQVFLPAASKVQDDPDKLRLVVGRFAGLAFLVAFAVGAGLASVSFELVILLLGHKWAPAVPFIPYAAIATAAVTLGNVFGAIYVIRDKQHISSRVRFLRLATIVLACGFAGKYYGMLAVSQAYALAAIVTVGIELKWLFSGKRFEYSLFAGIWRPLLASVTMYYCVTSLSLGSELHLIVVALIKVVFGALVYAASIALLWMLAGRPIAGEIEVWERLMEFRKSK